MPKFQVGDRVYHTWDVLKKPLIVVETFNFLGMKFVAQSATGEYTKDYEKYFELCKEGEWYPE